MFWLRATLFQAVSSASSESLIQTAVHSAGGMDNGGFWNRKTFEVTVIFPNKMKVTADFSVVKKTNDSIYKN